MEMVTNFEPGVTLPSDFLIVMQMIKTIHDLDIHVPKFYFSSNKKLLWKVRWEEQG